MSCCLEALQWGSRAREKKQQSRGGVSTGCAKITLFEDFGGGVRKCRGVLRVRKEQPQGCQGQRETRRPQGQDFENKNKTSRTRARLRNSEARG